MKIDRYFRLRPARHHGQAEPLAGTRAHDPGHDDHHVGSRRRFLRNLGLVTTGSVLLPGTRLHALGTSALAGALLDNPTDRVLVLVRLKGGNDGLNTIVPLYDFGAYAAARPQLGYAQSELLNLTSELAVSRDDFGAGYDLWSAGAMRVVNGVGYPDANLSHFRGTDIVTSASDAGEVLTSGWLGRHLDACFPDFLAQPPAFPPAIQIGGAGSLTFNNEENISLSVTVSNVRELTALAESGELYATSDLPDCRYGEELGYLRSVANSAFVLAAPIEDAYNLGVNREAYPQGELAAQLQLVARLIDGGLQTGVYLVTLEGFDTHAAQGQNHPRLLRQLGESVRAFYADLAAAGKEQRVVTATFSEFGRRIEQNASGGTDHGTAAPQLLFGPALQGNGVVGEAPDLNAPDRNGNLAFSTDFRSVYATLLERWLCVPPGEVDGILGDSFPRLDLGFDCQSVSTSRPRAERPQATLVRGDDGGWRVRFEAEAGRYALELLDTTGRLLARREVDLPAGEADLRLAGDDAYASLAAGAYAFRVTGPRGVAAAGVLPLLR